MDQVLDLAEKLSPSLDMNDRETLKQSVANLNGKLTSVTGAAQQQKAELNNMAAGWDEYQVVCCSEISFNMYFISIEKRYSKDILIFSSSSEV